MADVRLTATNPADSSVVPVACNSKGELLITEPVIQQIDNDVTINGALQISTQLPNPGQYLWSIGVEDGSLCLDDTTTSTRQHQLGSTGFVKHTRTLNGELAQVRLCNSSSAYQQLIIGSPATYTISWEGTASGKGFRILLEANNPDQYSSVRNAETGEDTMEYIGPVMDVREELESLRSQVQALMLKMNMTPESELPVEDGSADA